MRSKWDMILELARSFLLWLCAPGWILLGLIGLGVPLAFTWHNYAMLLLLQCGIGAGVGRSFASATALAIDRLTDLRGR